MESPVRGHLKSGIIEIVEENPLPFSQRDPTDDGECDDFQPLVMNHNNELPTTSGCYGTGGLILTEEKMKRKLRFFFMNPIEKWQAKRRFPYKFVVQLVKIVLVTVQLCLFAHSRYKHVNYTWDNRVSFSHLFLKGWDPTREVKAYPPGVGPLALYKINEFYETVDFAVVGYANIGNAIGTYSYTAEDNSMPAPVLCLFQYRNGIVYGFNESYVFDGEIDKTCVNLTVAPNVTAKNYSSKKFLEDQGINISFSRIVSVTLTFSLKTVYFKAAGPFSPPDCYRFDIEIAFDNEDHDGQMLLLLDADAVHLYCKGDLDPVHKSGMLFYNYVYY
ncbi:hypothetical protein C0J52_17558 [Blattella germanica]|nr:hypothetical protein C0J52_17558 [Blattella germanica]